MIIIPAIGAGTGLVYLERGLPPVETLKSYQPSLATRVYSDDNRLIGQFFVERRIQVSLSKLPRELIQAVIAIEDSRFYEHGGFDFRGILRAAVTNISSMKIKQGASTITQQLARSLFLTPERNIKRKFKEILLARKIEKLFTKDQILEMYLNQIYFGHGAYGVQAAARTYFDRDVGTLTLPECAFLAGLPKAPRDYSPHFSPQRAKRRQGIVLGRMQHEGFITEAQFNEAYQEDLFFKKLKPKQKIAPYFVEYVRQYLMDQYGDEVVYKGGLNVYTTLNIEMQLAAAKAVREGLKKIDKRQGFRGVLDHRILEEASGGEEGTEGSMATGEPALSEILEAVVTQVKEDHVRVEVSGLAGKILMRDMAWAKKRLKSRDLKNVEILKNPAPADLLEVGDVVKVAMKGKESGTGELLFSLEQDPLVQAALLALDPRTGDVVAMVGGYDFKESEFNRAISAKRQPGSAFKPLIYGVAVERGMNPATILMDTPVIFTDPVSQKTWKPTNYERRFYGPISLRDALTYSRNVATIKLLGQVGIQNVINFSRRMGITSPLSADLSLALGSSGLSLLELVSAYGVFANQGQRAEPIMVRMVTDSTGNVLEYHEPAVQKILSPEVSYIVSNLLQDVIQRGTGRRARDLGHSVAGKTGTTNDFTDAWFVGFAPNLSAGVWVGFDDRRSLGNHEAGSVAALPIWKQFMQSAKKQMPEMTFPIPENVVFARVNPETGLLASEDEEQAKVEIFIKGREPLPSPPPKPSVIDFYRMDHPTPEKL